MSTPKGVRTSSGTIGSMRSGSKARNVSQKNHLGKEVVGSGGGMKRYYRKKLKRAKGKA